MAKRGAFIVMEGLDRSGKTTQTQKLCEHLQRTNTVKLIKFPDRTTPIGKMIDAYLRSQSELDDRAIHLLFSANRWECAGTIEAELRAGNTVICDRYAFSGVAFSASKPSLSYEWCKAPDISLPAPDAVVFLDISPEVAQQRGGYGEERYEKEEMQRTVRQIFRKIETDTAQANGHIIWATIDASGTLDEVQQRIQKAVEPLNGGITGEIQRLWM